MSRGQHLAVIGTCFVGALTYAGVVTTWAMGVFVLPGVVGAALIATLLAARRMSGMAIVVVGALVLGWAELANIWTGTANGPAARSTAFAAGWTLVAVVFAHSPWPALFLAGVVGLVVAALALGAAGEVGIVAVAAAVCAALTLGWIEASRRNWTAPPQRGIALVFLSLLAGLAATGAVLLQAHEDPRDPALVAQGRQFPTIKPAWTDPLATDSDSSGTAAPRVAPSKLESPRPDSRPAAKPATGSHDAPTGTHASRSIWFYVLVAIVLVVLVLAAVVAARLLSTRLAWRRVRRRLAVGAPADQVIGAWAWTRMRLEACRLPLAAALSPDMVVVGGAMDGVPADVYLPLQALAARTTTAAFSREQSPRPSEVAVVWKVAEKADTLAREHLTRRARTRLAFRGPAFATVSEHEGASRAPGRQKVVARRRPTMTRAAILVGAGAVGVGLCLAGLVGFGVFSDDKLAVPSVSLPTKPVPSSTPTATEPTIPRNETLPPPRAPSQTLAPGDTGSQVTILQRALAELGFLAGKPDGDYGPATQSAVERFQASEGLPQVGVVGPQTLAELQQALSRRQR